VTRDGMTLAELLTMPVTVDIGTASRALGLSRSTGYELARRGEFPCRVLHVGSSYRVPTAELLRLLGIDTRGLGPGFPGGMRPGGQSGSAMGRPCGGPRPPGPVTEFGNMCQ
jgi:predicted DNA-binding transcriptional regulator AlpA